jgi:hypothetical protein
MNKYHTIQDIEKSIEELRKICMGINEKMGQELIYHYGGESLNEEKYNELKQEQSILMGILNVLKKVYKSMKSVEFDKSFDAESRKEEYLAKREAERYAEREAETDASFYAYEDESFDESFDAESRKEEYLAKREAERKAERYASADAYLRKE